MTFFVLKQDYYADMKEKIETQLISAHVYSKLGFADGFSKWAVAHGLRNRLHAWWTIEATISHGSNKQWRFCAHGYRNENGVSHDISSLMLVEQKLCAINISEKKTPSTWVISHDRHHHLLRPVRRCGRTPDGSTTSFHCDRRRLLQMCLLLIIQLYTFYLVLAPYI
jgi:hypothetical protein